MTENQLPCDVIWLDIEYSDQKKYFMWDKKAFPEPKIMLDKIVEEGRKLITIIDPHIKHDPDYFICKKIMESKSYVQTKEETPFLGHCWPGESIWIDFLNPIGREILSSLY